MATEEKPLENISTNVDTKKLTNWDNLPRFEDFIKFGGSSTPPPIAEVKTVKHIELIKKNLIKRK